MKKMYCFYWNEPHYHLQRPSLFASKQAAFYDKAPIAASKIC